MGKQVGILLQDRYSPFRTRDNWYFFCAKCMRRFASANWVIIKVYEDQFPAVSRQKCHTEGCTELLKDGKVALFESYKDIEIPEELADVVNNLGR